MTTLIPQRSPTFIVGIGASAGGLDALERFFDNLPKATGMAFVIVQHLSPDFRSLMDELLARHTALPIQLVEDGMPVEADHVYLIPPKKEMIISGGRLLLSERDRKQELNLPIDVFFRSLAQDCGVRAVAIVLSGSGSDGSRGILDVSEAGGLVIVQDIASAQFDGMPRTAHDAGVAHFVLPPADMPKALMKHVRDHAESRPPEASADDDIEPKGFDVVYRMLLEEFGIDFTHYKPSTITRRIERRLSLARSQDIEEYVRRLKSERGELDVLYRDLLIGVTSFFRDSEAFSLLETHVLPELLQREPRDQPIRLWTAGCATGEEPYSLAIALQDLMAKYGERQVKIFATDVHRGSLEHATRAIYAKEAVANVSEDRLDRYFIRIGETYQVVPELRQMVVFAQHNVIKDAPFTRIDLISCRNLLIYLQPSVQQRVLALFHFALNRRGALLLGPSETAGALARAFEQVDKQWRLYRKFTDARVPVETRMPPLGRGEIRSPGSPVQQPAQRYSLSQLLGTYETLLSDVMPPSLLLSERGELVHSFGGASRFLRLRDGRQGLDVLDLVEPELKLVLVGALKRVLSETAPIVYKPIRLGSGDDAGVYRMTIRRITSKTGAAHVLASFDQVDAVIPAPGSATELEIDQGSREQIRMLEAELSHTKENLQSAIEELEASNEELQASNEELQASNEELQSTNEELQSVNEELYTVNAEYQRKIAELIELTNDIDNLLSSTEVGTIFLDSQLLIRKYTPQIAETFDLLPHDIGRSIESFAHKLEHTELVDDLRQVLRSGNPLERELRNVRGRTFFLRILPYRVKGAPDGVVLTLIDVSSLKEAENALFHERHLLNSLLSSIPDAIYFKDSHGRLIRVNQAMARRLGLKEGVEAEGRSALEMPDKEAALALHVEDEAVLRQGEAQHDKLERSVRRDGSELWNRVTRLPLRDPDGRIVGIIALFRDVTEQKRAEEKIIEAVRRRDQFLAMLSHELRNPLGAMVTATSLLKRGGKALQNRDKLLAVLERQSQQMSHLLDDLLEASRVTQNKIELKKRVVDLRIVLRDAADAVRNQFDARDIQFTMDLGDTPLLVLGDPARLQQIQVNLLNNAAKYTSASGHVGLTLRREQDDAVIRLRDDGAGMAASILDSVFELFVQSSRTLDRSAGGLGVGLTLVRSLVAMHGGTVNARSDGEGQGSEFVVRLPLTAQAADQELPPAPAPAPPAPRRAMRPLRDHVKVVIVEDNADTRELLCELLVSAGFECRAAETGATALALIEEVSPDIAILDVGLPEVNGFELARRIRSHARHGGIRLIALTGYGQAADRETALSAGFDEHLVKPVDSDDLLKLLADMRGGALRQPVADSAE